MREVPGVRAIDASAVTGGILITFDPVVPLEDLVARVAQALSGPSRERRQGSPARAPAGLPTPLVQLALLADGANALRRTLRREPPRTRGPKPHSGDAQPSRSWHAEPQDDVLTALESTTAGLTNSDATSRLSKFGPNALAEPEHRSELMIFLGQLRSTPVLLLFGSAALSAATGGVGDAVAILAVIGVNATIGYLTESSAERTIRSLERRGARTARVLRDAAEVELPVESLVPGDVVLLGPATVVPADARLVACDSLVVDESSLTGESVPVAKQASDPTAVEAPLGDRSNMVYRGTIVTGGAGAAIVVATGLATEIGRIQALLGTVTRPATPLQLELERLSTQLAIGAGVICVGVLGLGLLRRMAPLAIAKTSISLGVAAVPEGLPTVAITTLALGIRRMRELHVMVRQLGAVETLGALEVLCLDKTGTITENRMRIVDYLVGLPGRPPRQSERDWLDRVAVLCSEVELGRGGDDLPALTGTPTETALVRFALEAGCDVDAERARHPRLSTRYRAPGRNYMSTLHEAGSEYLLAVKGAPMDVIARATLRIEGDAVVPLTEPERETIRRENERMAGAALRVLGCAFRVDPSPDVPAEDLVWVGLLGMADPPRAGMPELFGRFHRAGIRTVMITGDQSATASAIAKQVGLCRDGRLEILDSTRLEGLDPEVLKALAGRADVFSRVSPAHKLQIVQALQSAGRVVAMTGDGVNDGPALKAADVGIAMGKSGTDVARDVADVVIQDDDLSSIIVAVEQGRTIYDDIKKALHFILSTNLAEILVTAAQVAFGPGETLSPMQLLWINLLTDVFPELALAVEPPETDVLARPPRRAGSSMFARHDFARIAVEGGLIGGAALGAYVLGGRGGGGAGAPAGGAAGAAGAARGAGRAGSLTFHTLTTAQLLFAISARSEEHSIFDRSSLAKNAYIPAAIAGSIGLGLLADLAPPIRTLLGTSKLSAADWAIVAGLSTVPLLASEVFKLLFRKGGPLERLAPRPRTE
jgi:P-type Ca2+ transporter type 2C